MHRPARRRFNVNIYQFNDMSSSKKMDRQPDFKPVSQWHIFFLSIWWWDGEREEMVRILVVCGQKRTVHKTVQGSCLLYYYYCVSFESGGTVSYSSVRLFCF